MTHQLYEQYDYALLSSHSFIVKLYDSCICQSLSRPASQCPLHQGEPVPCTLYTAGCGNSCNNVGGVEWCDGAGWVQRATVTEHDNTGAQEHRSGGLGTGSRVLGKH